VRIMENFRNLIFLGFPLWVCDHPTLVKVAEELGKTSYLEKKVSFFS
jgi:hypothetical protein